MSLLGGSGLKRPSASLYDDNEADGGENATNTNNNNNTTKDSEGPPSKKKNEGEHSEPATAASSSKSECMEDSSTTFPFISAFGSRKGDREEMQDRHLALDSLQLLQAQAEGDRVIQRAALFALFDGHGGSAAANYCHAGFAKKLAGVFNKHVQAPTDFPAVEKAMKRVLTDAYKGIDDDFLAQARRQKPVLKDGTTATSLLLINNIIYAANVGDSKAVACRLTKDGEERSWIAMPLTTEHSPTIFTERTRIQKAGGFVKDGRVMGVLEVSRSIGDGQFKAHGVVATPDVRKLSLTANDAFLILACDGLWKSFTSEEAIRFSIDKYQGLVGGYSAGGLGTTKKIWTKVAEELASDAVLRGCGDNVSVVLVVFVDHVAKLI